MLVIQVVCNVTNVALKGLFKWEWGEILTGVGIVANPSRIGRSGLNIKRSAKVNRNITIELTRDHREPVLNGWLWCGLQRTKMKLSYNQDKMLDLIGADWTDIPPIFRNITRTSEALRDRGLVELRRKPGSTWKMQAKRRARR